MTEQPINPCKSRGGCCMHMAAPPYIPGPELDRLLVETPQVYADYESVVATRQMQWEVVGDSMKSAEMIAILFG